MNYYVLKKTIPVLLSFAVLAGCAGPKTQLKVGATAEGEVVEAQGLAAMTDDLLAVKRAALEDARKNAVEKVVGVLISGRTMVEKAITIQQNILAKTDGYVKNYEVLKEGVESDGIYHTHIRAFVSYKEVRNDLAANDLLKAPAVGNPRVAILLDETLQGSEEQSTACSDALAQGLLEKGYKVVDRSELAAIRVAEATQDLLAGRNDKALKPIVQKLNAEVVITGKATGQLLTTEGLGGLISYRGTMSAKALKAQSGEILATASVQGSGLDATKEAAAQKAMMQLGKNAANEFKDRIASELARRSSVAVTVRGLKDINQLGIVKSLLVNTSGVEDLYLRSFANGDAEMEVKTKTATSLDLANVLSRNPSLTMQVTTQTQELLEVQVSGAGK